MASSLEVKLATCCKPNKLIMIKGYEGGLVQWKTMGAIFVGIL